jgi:WD40 repeat protein
MLPLKGHTDTVYGVAYSADGRLLASASGDRTARIWDLATGRVRHILAEHGDTVWRAVFTADGRSLVTAGFDGGARVWDVADGSCRRILAAGDAQVRGLALADQDRILFVGVHGLNVAARSWDLARERGWDGPRERGRFDYQMRGFLGDRDYQSLPLGGVWRRPAEAPVRADPSYWGFGQTIALARAADGRLILGRHNYYRSDLVLLDPARDQVEALVHYPGTIRALARRDPQPLLAVAADNEVRLWDLDALEVRAVLRGHDDWVWDVAWAADGQTLLTAGRDGAVKLWQPDGRLLADWRWGLGPVWCVAFAPDGMTAAAGGQDGTLLVWDIGL